MSSNGTLEGGKLNGKKTKIAGQVVIVLAGDKLRVDFTREKRLSSRCGEDDFTESRRPIEQQSKGLQNIDPKSRTGPENAKALDYKIMVVDDEKKIADLYSIILKSAGFSVDRIVHDGLEAIDAVKCDLENCPDVILMDQKMPRMDGLEASKKIKEMNPEIKIIMISAYDVPPESLRFLSLILAKPISKRQLLEAIETV